MTTTVTQTTGTMHFSESQQNQLPHQHQHRRHRLHAHRVMSPPTCDSTCRRLCPLYTYDLSSLLENTLLQALSMMGGYNGFHLLVITLLLCSQKRKQGTGWLTAFLTTVASALQQDLSSLQPRGGCVFPVSRAQRRNWHGKLIASLCSSHLFHWELHC